MTEPASRGDAAPAHSDNQVDSAAIAGDVVQARDVTGGIHFHARPGDPRTFRVTPRQLPANISAFVNRQPELAQLGTLIGSGGSATGGDAGARGPAAVVVITGSAGVGKTALALHWAHRIRSRFPDGEIYANLRGYDEGAPLEAGLVLDRMLRDLGVPGQVIPSAVEERAGMFRSLVAGRRVLLVLDNAATVSQVRPLLPGGPGPFVIVTSRSALSGLTIRDGASRVQLDILREPDAVALLREVTRSGSRQDSDADLLELARLCARLPLALRIAAERAVSRPAMRLAELIADLRDDSSLWDTLSTGDGFESEAVRTVFAWSYRGLPEAAARMFRVLGLHPGREISLAAAAAAAAVPLRDARRALDILAGAYMVEHARTGRYQLHDLLKAYALDQAQLLDTEEDRAATLDRAVRWYILAAAAAGAVVAPGDSIAVNGEPLAAHPPPSFRSPPDALEWFEAERDNLVACGRAALSAGRSRPAWQLAMALSPVHMHTFTFDDWAELSELAVTAAADLRDPAMTGAALANRGRFCFRRGLMAQARAAHEAALSAFEQAASPRGACESLNALGLLGLRSRDLGAAADCFERAAAGFRELGDQRWEALAQSNLAEAYLEQGDAGRALAILPALPAQFRLLGDPGCEGNALWLLSWARRLDGDLTEARTAIEAALSVADAAANRVWEAFWLIESARLYLTEGTTDEAMRCCRAAAALEKQIGDRSREAAALDCTGEILLAAGNPGDAAAFHLEASRLYRELGDPWHEALALLHLAGCESALGRAGPSAEHRIAAARLLRSFSDASAIRLLRDLEPFAG